MRAYKFLDEKWGLDSLLKKRLKQARAGDLNDPFDLTPFDMTDPAIRIAFQDTRNDMDKATGLVCLSKAWNNPVIWAHYSDKHKGLCLGFDIPDPNADNVLEVEYTDERLSFPANYLALSEAEGTQITRRALFVKYAHWHYENEVRIWGPLENEEGGLYFVPFDEQNLKLVEVIVGTRCMASRESLVKALGPLAGSVTIRKARASHDKFEMVEDTSVID